MAQAASFRQAAQDSVTEAGIFSCQNYLASHLGTYSDKYNTVQCACVGTAVKQFF